MLGPVGVCSLLRHVPKRLVNPTESSSRMFWGTQDNQQGKGFCSSDFPTAPGRCPCPQSVIVLQVRAWLRSPGEIQAQSFRARILSKRHNVNLF